MRFRSKQKAIYYAVDQTLVRRHHIIKLSVAFLNVVALILVTTASLLTNNNKPAVAASYTWDGGGTTNNWSDCDNWSADICPTAADTVTFNNTSTKDSVVDASFSGTVTSVTIANTYTGTITQAKDLTTSGSFSFTAGGTFNAGNNNLLVGGGFTTGAGVNFNAGTGTVVFNGTTGATIACNNAAFNRVEFQHTAGVKTVSNNCNLPLGNNPTITFSVTLNGTLTGSGTLSRPAGTTIINSTGNINGFSSINSASTFTLTGPTLDWSGMNSLIVSGPFTVNTSTNFTAPATADFNSSFILNSGSTFTASSNEMTLAGGVGINSGATFNHNNGTVTFDGGSATITCGNAIFNLVKFNAAPNTVAKTINNDCVLPVGANPSMGESRFTLAGTITGSGTLPFPALLTLNPGAQISGFDEMSVASTFTVTTGTNFTAPAVADFNGAFVLNSGSTFTAPADTMYAIAAFTINAGATFNHNNGTVVLDGGGTVTCNSAVFSHVIFQNTGNVAVSSGCSLPIGHNPILGSNGGPVTLQGELTGSGSFTALSTIQLRSGYDISDFSDLVINGLVLRDGVVADFSSHNSLTLGALVLQEGSTMISGTWNLPIASNITLQSGTTFNPNGGTVILTGSNQTITGDITFHNLIKTASAPSTLMVGAGSTVTVQGTLTLQGADQDNLLSLVSTTPGTQWNINAVGPRTLQYLSVQDSNNTNPNTMLAYDSEDLGNNTNWQFLASPTPESPVSNSSDSSVQGSGELAETGISRNGMAVVGVTLLLVGAAAYLLRLAYDKIKV